MQTYRYEAVDNAGRILTGEVELDRAELLDPTLRGRGLFLLSARQAQPREAARRRTRSVVRMTRALASLLESGLPLTRALSSLAQNARPSEAAMLLDVRRRLEKGAAFAQALEPHSSFFSPLFLSVVAAGERTGTLPGALGRLATHSETELEIRQKIVSAAVYPLLLTATGGTSVLLLLFWVLPRFAALLEEAGAVLPWSTAAMLGLSTVLRATLPLVAPVGLLLLGALGWITTSTDGRSFVFRQLLRLPWIGTYRREAVGARFARLMSVLLRGGAPALEALRITAQSFTDPIIRAELLGIHGRVREGESLTKAMTASPLFPSVLLDLGRFGEESARLPDFLERAAELLEANGQETLRRATVVAEPLLIVGFGLIVGAVALSLMQAIYGLNAGVVR